MEPIQFVESISVLMVGLQFILLLVILNRSEKAKRDLMDRHTKVQQDLLNRLMSKDFTDYARNVPFVDHEIIDKKKESLGVHPLYDGPGVEATDFPGEPDEVPVM